MAEANNIKILSADTDEDFDWIERIRDLVFREELGIDLEGEIEVNDFMSTQYLALFDGVPAGTGRWRITSGNKIRLEFFAVLPEYRKHGIGNAILDRIMSDIPREKDVYLFALDNVVRFYEGAGFRKEGEPFVEAGLNHIKMVLDKE